MKKNKNLALILFATILTSCSTERPTFGDCYISDSLPDIFPQYAETTVPWNIAPLCFQLNGGKQIPTYTLIEGSKSGKIEVDGIGEADIPSDDWKELIKKNIEGQLNFTVYTKEKEKWTKNKTFSVNVSKHSIDQGVIFREVIPGYSKYTRMQLTQHNLTTSKEEPFFMSENTFNETCLNCHTTNRGNAQQLTFHVRTDKAIGGTMIKNGNKDIRLYDVKGGPMNANFVYPYWHPDGRYIAYSQNKTAQQFPMSMDHRIEVFDDYGAICVFDTKTNNVLRSPLLNDTTYMCNCPAFSADGKKLYFCLSKQKRQGFKTSTLKNIKYSLCSIDFDPKTGKYGNKIDTIINAAAMGKSIAYPRPSYDGKYILYSLADYGYFHIHHKEGDLWLYDIEKQEAKPLDAVNSNESESFHNWSSDSRWIVFCSRRYDGFTAHLYFATKDDKGNWTKPFMMPRRHPYESYTETPYSQTVPDFITSPIEINIQNAVYQLENNIAIKAIQ